MQKLGMLSHDIFMRRKQHRFQVQVQSYRYTSLETSLRREWRMGVKYFAVA